MIIGKWLLKWRKVSLLGAFTFSIGIAVTIIWHSDTIMQILCVTYNNQDAVFRGLLYSLSPLPLFFLLWFFRHTDTQKNINQSALFEAQRLILKPDNAKKSIAITQLKILLRDVEEFRETIYIALKAGLQFNVEWKNQNKLCADFSDCDLRGIDLREAQLVGGNFKKADLQDADLREANLQAANLQKTKLQKSNFCKADLRLANLWGANLHGINWQASQKLLNSEDCLLPTYSDETKFSNYISGHNRNGTAKEKEAFQNDLLTGYRLIHVYSLVIVEMNDKREEYRKKLGLPPIT